MTGSKHERSTRSAKRRNGGLLNSVDEGNRSARLAADRNNGKRKFMDKIPDKALRSTF